MDLFFFLLLGSCSNYFCISESNCSKSCAGFCTRCECNNSCSSCTHVCRFNASGCTTCSRGNCFQDCGVQCWNNGNTVDYGSGCSGKYNIFIEYILYSKNWNK